ncbi:MAG TPA: ureidoglycolate lyase [Burkholderiaceae bacterium]|nr:ureidoglycolate lyase [Burkholderiaceae bacterium]
MVVLKLQTISKQRFAPFGDLIEIADTPWFPINNGTTKRYHDLANVQVLGKDGRVGISLAKGEAFRFPLTVSMLERHPVGSQAWLPFNQTPFVVVVAPNGPDDKPLESGLQAFYVEGHQGVNYHVGTWHHPLMAIDQVGDFIVVDRIGETPNCDEVALRQTYQIKRSQEEA